VNKAFLFIFLFIFQYAIAEQIIVDGVFVEKKSSNGVLAKEFALNSGIKKLLEKIAIDFYPNVKFGNLNSINLNNLQEAVIGYSISDEKISTHSYSARMKYVLDYTKIKPIIRQIESNSKLKTYLIIPFRYDVNENLFFIDEKLLLEFSEKIKNYKNIKTIRYKIDEIIELNSYYNENQIDFFREKSLIEYNADELILVKILSNQEEFEIEYIPQLKKERFNLQDESLIVNDVISLVSNPVRNIKINRNPQTLQCTITDLSDWKYIREFFNNNFQYTIKNVENDIIVLDIYHDSDINTFLKILKRNKIEVIYSNGFLELSKK
jgi:hypothetical protein